MKKVVTVLDFLEQNSPYSMEELVKIHDKGSGDRVVSQYFIGCCSDSLKEIILCDAYDDTCYVMKDFRVDEKDRVSFFHTRWRIRSHLGAHLEDILESELGDR